MTTATLPEAGAQIEFKLTRESLSELSQNPDKVFELNKTDRQAVLKAAADPDKYFQEPTPAIFDTPAQTITPTDPASQEVAAQPGEQPLDGEKKEGFYKEQKRDARYWKTLRESEEATYLEKKKLNDELDAKMKAASELKVESPVDSFTDEHQNASYVLLKQLAEKVKVIEEFTKQNLGKQVQDSETSKANITEKSIFAELEDLQNEFPAYKTTKPISLLNREYADFLNDVVAKSGLLESKELKDSEKREIAVQRYKSDPEFQKLVTHKLPDEMEKLNTLLLAHNRKETSGGTLRGNLYDILHETGKLQEITSQQIKGAAQDATQRTLAAMNKPGELKTLGPADGIIKAQNTGVITKDEATKILQNLIAKQQGGSRWTPGDKQLHEQCMKVMTGAIRV